MKKDDRTFYDLSEEELEESENNPEKYQEINDNTIEDSYDMMFPNDDDGDEYD